MATDTDERSTSTDDTERAVTVTNIQRLESGYFDHMQSLRDRIPVGEYLVAPETGRLALLVMAGFTIALFVAFPYTMFHGYTYLVTIVYLAAFIAFGWVFYDRVMEPNENTESWRE